jgi:hypothetical protein
VLNKPSLFEPPRHARRRSPPCSPVLRTSAPTRRRRRGKDFSSAELAEGLGAAGNRGAGGSLVNGGVDGTKTLGGGGHGEAGERGRAFVSGVTTPGEAASRSGKSCSTPKASRAVYHPFAKRATCRLTSEVERVPAHCTCPMPRPRHGRYAMMPQEWLPTLCRRCGGMHDSEGIRTPAGRAEWISSPSP